MAWQKIASGGILDVADIERYETDIAEGQRGLLEFNLRTVAPEWAVSELQSQLVQRGVKEAQVSISSPVLRISWRKGFPWLAVIAGIILAIAVLAILIISWSLYKEVFPDGLPAPVSIGLIVAVLAIVGMLVWQRRRR